MKISREEFLRETPITEKEFKKIAQYIDMTYPARTRNEIPFLFEKESFDNWYELLKDRLYLPMMLGVKKYCLENKYQPAVSDISEYTQEMTIGLKETRRLIEYNLDNLKYHINPCFFDTVKFSEEEINNYYDLILENEVKDWGGYTTISSNFTVFVKRNAEMSEYKIQTLQEFIDLWRDYWKKRKNPS